MYLALLAGLLVVLPTAPAAALYNGDAMRLRRVHHLERKLAYRKLGVVRACRPGARTGDTPPSGTSRSNLARRARRTRPRLTFRATHDTYLFLRDGHDKNGTIRNQNDDSGGTRNSRIISSSGRWRLHYQRRRLSARGQTGAHTVTISTSPADGLVKMISGPAKVTGVDACRSPTG